MKLTQDEKNKLITAKDEVEWYALCEEIKSRRNGLYPNDLAREVLTIYQNKFPVNKYPAWEELIKKESLELSQNFERKSVPKFLVAGKEPKGRDLKTFSDMIKAELAKSK